MSSARTVQRCDVIRQLLREEGAMTAFEIAQLLPPDLLDLPEDWRPHPALIGVRGRHVVAPLLAFMLSVGLVGCEREGRVMRWFVWIEDQEQVDQFYIDQIEAIPHSDEALG